jgi:heterodisulfide reductase subunit A
MMSDKVGAVLVVGGGIAGMQASLDLADADFKVYLVDRRPTIGGRMAQLDKTFPTNDCAMCIMAPKLVSTGRHHNIELVTNATIESIEGEPGNFTVTLRKHPRRIDESKCTGCGICAQKCPIEAISEYNEGLGPRKAIYVRYPQAVPLVYSIDTDNCIGCGICAEECKAGAVEYDQEEKILKLEVGSVILAPGFEKFDASLISEYGYGVYKNVLSSIEFERLLSASGPYLGMVLRPSDGEIPRKIAFIQCVGSRDERTNTYCSAVCCMYAVKEAVIAKEHVPGVETTIFFMDLRAYGKEFDDYYRRAVHEGVRFIRARVSEIHETDGNNLILRYVGDGEPKEEEFDLVVLSIGMGPPPHAEDLAKKLGIELNRYGFTYKNPFSPLELSPGIYAAGAFVSPKDIPDTVAQASGAAALASSLISEERGKLVKAIEFPPERDVSGEPPRIGVFICNCGINIGAVVNVEEVVEYAKTLPDVAHAEGNLYTCSQDTQAKIREKIEELKLNRVIVASCTPRTHQPLFQNTCREAGLNPYLFEMANIREHCSWVHPLEKEKATEKAKALVRMAVAKARLLEPLFAGEVEIIQKALVIGGGLSGMTAALLLAEEGFETFLVEKENRLGGNLRKLHHLLGDENPKKKLDELIKKVEGNGKIKVFRNARVISVEGTVGNFRTRISGSEEKILEHGVVILATGAQEYKPKEYGYGSPGVVTQTELEELLEKKFDARSVVMIQCVGSRNDESPNCSRVCCSEAIKNALRIKELSPDTQIFILYRDIRTYGFREEFYREASEKGIIFIRYEEESPPEVETSEGLKVRVKEPLLEKEIILEPDLIVLSAGIRPNPENQEFGKLLKVPLSKDGFFLEAHMKLRPVDFMTEGIFLCGLAHGPKFIEESISQAYGTVSRACTILSKRTIKLEPLISFVVDENCDGCAYCVEPCPFDAITLIEYMKNGSIKKTVEVDETACKGCGTCMATCPKKGIYVRGFRLEQISAQVEAALA